MIHIERYTNEMREQWNAFLENAKNPLFMFHRDYMEYHRDRFTDLSLLFFSDEKLVALLPLNIKDDNEGNI